MRDLARDLGLTPKGGFRLDRAPAHVLAPLLAEQRDREPLDRVLALLLPHQRGDVEPASEPGPAAAVDLQPLLTLREAELARLREDLERAREASNRGRDREAEAARQLQQLATEVAKLRGAVAHSRPEAAPPALDPRDDKGLQRRLHDLESERDGFAAADQALRRQLAHNQSRLRELEATVQELEALLPKGKRRRKPPPAEPEPAGDRRCRLPHFAPAFYKSLEGKDRRAIERAFQAILLFATEGHGYPGLEVKQLGGQDTWSLRASLGLRVYFRPLPDGDFELLELGDREDQHTTLRRLKER
jgi:hypothetical protein